MTSDKINANDGAPESVPKSAFRGDVANNDEINATKRTARSVHDVLLSGSVNDPFLSDCNAITTKRTPPNIGRMRFLINNPLIPNSGKNPREIKPTTVNKLIKKNCE